MKIVLFHPVPLPPKDYGGVERVVLWLATALRDLGHEPWIAALPGSRLPPGVGLVEIPADARSAASLLTRLPSGTDIVHFHAPPEREFTERAQVPWLVTVHGNGKPGEAFAENAVFLSRDHAQRHGRNTFVHNGVDPAEFRFQGERPRARPLFLSKTSWKVKNLSAAIEIATAARESLTIAGGHRSWLLRAGAMLRGHRWVGPVAGERKAELLAGASSLLFPVRWPEPFGLVMVESMLSGTPVVGSRIGSVPEVVGEAGGVTVDAPFWESTDRAERVARLGSWIEALGRAEKMDRGAVREEALRRFSNRRMAEDYLNVYKQVIRGERL